MTLAADHCLDYPQEYYISEGCSRIHDKQDFVPEDVQSGDIVFVKTDFIYTGQFTQQYFNRIKNPFILVTGVSSFQVGANGNKDYIELLESEKVLKWFCTNPPELSHRKLHAIPIGFEEYERPGGNQTILSIFSERDNTSNKLDKVYLPYHTLSTNPNRVENVEYLKSLDFVEVETSRMGFYDYLEKMSKYKYVICLEGAGWDTHRNYEALLVGSIPIMKSSVISQIYKKEQLPSVFINDWTKLAEKSIPQYSPDMFKKVKNFLKIGYHLDKIRASKGNSKNETMV